MVLRRRSGVGGSPSVRTNSRFVDFGRSKQRPYERGDRRRGAACCALACGCRDLAYFCAAITELVRTDGGKPRPYDRTVAACNIVIPLAKPSGTPRMVTLARAGPQDDHAEAEDAEGDQRGEGGILATLPTRLSTSGDSPTVSTSWGRPAAGRRAREHLMVPVDFSVVAERP